MSANPLEAAHEVVQDRKGACGMPEVTGVLAGEAVPTPIDEGSGMFVGTNLTRGDVSYATGIATGAVLAMIASGGMDLTQALGSLYVEGLLVGIEYGRGLAG